MSVLVKPVESRRERKAFLAFPWELYRQDPHWIPPLRQNQKQLVGYARHPFHADAEVQTFLAFRGGNVCGRLAAILNHAHNRYHQEQRGFFGFFESVDDEAVAAGLFDAARQWFADRGISQIRGPVNPSLNYEVGLLVDGFDAPPTFMMTYNPPYYARLIEAAGFRKVQDMYAFGGTVDMLDSLDAKLEFIVNAAKERFGIHLRPINKSRFRKDIELFLEIYNRSLVATWGFVPMSPKEVRHLSASLKLLIDPELALIAEVDGKAIGALFGLPDYNPRIKDIDGRLFPFGVFKLLSRKHTFRRFRVISANVLPEYQSWGVGLVLLNGLIPRVLSSGLTEAEFSWVLESNHFSRKSLEKGGAILEKTYRIYDWPPPAQVPEPAMGQVQQTAAMK